ncbi:MAG TPA: ribosome biogenesis factor YjgA [Kofleriaceae bacterium]|nr:ribosome biogenesis factor YjgA [Kofleriaceae bacterium]
MSNDDDENPRVLVKRQKRAAGDRSAKLARILMQVPDTTVGKLELGEELQDEVERARKVTSQIARRRAERTLAGALRAIDLVDLQRKLDNVQATGSAEPRMFHLAEKWRARLIEEGSAAAEQFPGGNVDPLPSLIHQARRERDTGKPPGAARALFRHVLEVLKTHEAGQPADDETDETDENDDEPAG